MNKFSAKQILGVALGVLGILLALGSLIVGATRDTTEVTTVNVPASDSVFVYTEAGVLDLLNTQVKVTLEAEGATVYWGLASTDDAKAYVGESSAVAVQGLKSATAAKTTEVTGKAATAQTDAKALQAGTLKLVDADLWLRAESAEGKAQFDLDLADQSSRSLVATTSKGTSPALTLEWTRDAAPFPVIPLSLLGVFIALVGAFLLYRESQAEGRVDFFKNREELKRAERDERADAATSIIPRLKDESADDSGAGDTEVVAAEHEADADETVLAGAEEATEEAADENADEVADDASGDEATEAAAVDVASDTADEAAEEVTDDVAAEPAEQGTQASGEKPAKTYDWRSLWSFGKNTKGEASERDAETTETTKDGEENA